MGRELPEGFTAWRGGKNPAPGQRVRVIYAGSNVPARGVYEADKLDWNHASSGPNIIAFQVLGAVNSVAQAGLSIAIDGPQHRAFRTEAMDLLRKHAIGLSPIELLALSAFMVGQITALQDRSKVTADLATHITNENLRAGHDATIAALSKPQGQG